MRRALAGLLLTLLAGCRDTPAASSPPTQRQMNVNAQQDAQETDRALQRIYDEILPRLEPQDQERLRRTEQAWITYRDRNCEAETALYDDGSAAPLMRYACLAATTRSRVDELRRIYGDQLGLD